MAIQLGAAQQTQGNAALQQQAAMAQQEGQIRRQEQRNNFLARIQNEIANTPGGEKEYYRQNPQTFYEFLRKGEGLSRTRTLARLEEMEERMFTMEEMKQLASYSDFFNPDPQARMQAFASYEDQAQAPQEGQAQPAGEQEKVLMPGQQGVAVPGIGNQAGDAGKGVQDPNMSLNDRARLDAALENKAALIANILKDEAEGREALADTSMAIRGALKNGVDVNSPAFREATANVLSSRETWGQDPQRNAEIVDYLVGEISAGRDPLLSPAPGASPVMDMQQKVQQGVDPATAARDSIIEFREGPLAYSGVIPTKTINAEQARDYYKALVLSGDYTEQSARNQVAADLVRGYVIENGLTDVQAEMQNADGVWHRDHPWIKKIEESFDPETGSFDPIVQKVVEYEMRDNLTPSQTPSRTAYNLRKVEMEARKDLREYTQLRPISQVEQVSPEWSRDFLARMQEQKDENPTAFYGAFPAQIAQDLAIATASAKEADAKKAVAEAKIMNETLPLQLQLKRDEIDLRKSQIVFQNAQLAVQTAIMEAQLTMQEDPAATEALARFQTALSTLKEIPPESLERGDGRKLKELSLKIISEFLAETHPNLNASLVYKTGWFGGDQFKVEYGAAPAGGGNTGPVDQAAIQRMLGSGQ
jgi:hypothetical protein